MPHIQLPEGLQGIRSAMAFRPETAKPLTSLRKYCCMPKHAAAGRPRTHRDLRFLAGRLLLLSDCARQLPRHA